MSEQNNELSDLKVKELREQFVDDVKKIKQIIKEIKRTDETEGCYNPYNVTFPYLVKLTHEIRIKLEAGVEK